MHWFRVAVLALVVAACAGCGDSSSGSKEEKPLPGNRIPGGAGGKK